MLRLDCKSAKRRPWFSFVYGLFDDNVNNSHRIVSNYRISTDCEGQKKGRKRVRGLICGTIAAFAGEAEVNHGNRLSGNPAFPKYEVERCRQISAADSKETLGSYN
jgi:hypothetical protein